MDNVNPRTIEGGIYKLAGISYNTQYFPHSNLWGYIILIGAGGSTEPAGAIIFATDGIWVGQSENGSDILRWTNLVDYR